MKLPQLSLRELFLLVALVAMGCGWWVERGQFLAQKQRETDVAEYHGYQRGIDEATEWIDGQASRRGADSTVERLAFQWKLGHAHHGSHSVP